ncbi:hypothetical protein ACOMHN_050197 [Nucella lapillus]
MLSAVLGAVLAVGFLTGAVECQPEGDFNCPSIDADVTTCFRSRALGFSIWGDDLTQYLDPQVLTEPNFCDSLEGYKNATSCAYPFLERCLNQRSLGGGLPDLGKMLQGLDLACARKAEIDFWCLVRQMGSIERCVEGKLTTTQQGQTATPFTKRHVCRFVAAQADCAGKHLDSCSKTTKDTYLEIRSKYYVPRVCATNTKR